MRGCLLWSGVLTCFAALLFLDGCIFARLVVDHQLGMKEESCILHMREAAVELEDKLRAEGVSCAKIDQELDRLESFIKTECYYTEENIAFAPVAMLPEVGLGFVVLSTFAVASTLGVIVLLATLPVLVYVPTEAPQPAPRRRPRGQKEKKAKKDV